jgi:PIN domain nuclease of toxin-antitoxin system
MDEFVTDTHALYWYLAGMPQLSQAARASFDASSRGEARLLVPAIVLAELFYLNEKLGTPLDFASEFARLSAAPQIVFVPFDAEDVLGFAALQAVPEMHDRIIAGVALSRGCPCITRDPAIAAAGIVQTIW